MTRSIRIGITLLAVSVVAYGVMVVLAITGSRLAPSWRGSFAPMLIGMVGATLVLVSAMRATKLEEPRRQVRWVTHATLPPEVSIDERRKLRPLPPAPIMPALFGLVGLMFCGLMMALYPEARVWGALRDRGVEGTGVITNKRSHTGKHTWYYLDYQFRHGLLTSEDHARVSRARWDSVRTGDPVPVIYLPRTPEISLPMSRREMRLTDVFEPELLMILGMLLATTTAMALLLWTMQARTLRLVFEGTATIGEVTSVSGSLVRYSCGDITGSFLYRSAALPAPAPGDRFVLLRLGKQKIPWPHARAQFERELADTRTSLPARDIVEQRIDDTPARVTIAWPVPLFFLILFVTAVPFVIAGKQALGLRGRVARLRANGQETTGSVTSMLQIGRGTWTRIRFQYRAGSQQLQSVYVTSSTRLQERFTRGASTPVTYAADDPTIALPFRKADLSRLEIAGNVVADVILCAFVLTLVFAAALYVTWRVLIEWRLARGALNVGSVLEVRGTEWRKVRYRFMAQHGDVEHEVTIHSTMFRPVAGDRIAIVCAGSRSMPAADLLFVKRVAATPRASPASGSRDA